MSDVVATTVRTRVKLLFIAGTTWHIVDFLLHLRCPCKYWSILIEIGRKCDVLLSKLNHSWTKLWSIFRIYISQFCVFLLHCLQIVICCLIIPQVCRSQKSFWRNHRRIWQNTIRSCFFYMYKYFSNLHQHKRRDDPEKGTQFNVMENRLSRSTVSGQ